jgi:TetR/AcrR family transcriptional regulator, transcriptional repressor for nem operon
VAKSLCATGDIDFLAGLAVLGLRIGIHKMVRYAPEHKIVARAEIVRLASERLRADGIAAVGVRQLMADAGLTHGGFYAHFESRSELVHDAVIEASRSTLQYLREAASAALVPDRLGAIITAYLSRRHLDNMALGCAVAAFGSELVRENARTRAGFLSQNEAIIALITENLPSGGDNVQRQLRATGIFAGLMGTLQLARIAKDQVVVEQILEAGKNTAFLLAGFPIHDDCAT